MNSKKSVSFDFTGSKILVTGAAKGIGRDIALSFARLGALVAVTDRSTAELDGLRQEFEAEGLQCLTFAADLTKAEECMSMAKAVLEAQDGLDILINNAGISFPESIVDLDVVHWDITLAVNLRAPALISKVVAASMIAKKKGVIVNIASNACVGAIPDHAAYCASKFGLDGLTKVMAIELGPKGIRVNAIGPTIVLTPMGAQVWGDPKKADPVRAKIPLGRFLQPKEVTDLVMFLASDAAAMIHGETVLLDGGANAALY
jgi:NAD(P)-dependent dehydrogenase (short-subunit alcohol dehydrogenase family)